MIFVTDMKDVVLSKIELPSNGQSPQEEMYVRRRGGIVLHQDSIEMSVNGQISFDTYFNALSIEKWKTYTQLDMVKLAIYADGYFRVRLCQMYEQNNNLIRECLGESEVNIPDSERILTYKGRLRGLLYFELTALRRRARFYGAQYFTQTDAGCIRRVKLAVCICTYHREAYMLKNLEDLRKNMLRHENTAELEVFVADNGKTLRSHIKPQEGIHIYENPNLGGTAGFARCMLEVMNQNRQQAGFTHILLMDDDVVIEWGSIVKTCALLSLVREQYKDAFIGGAMLRLDRRNIQTESGARWNHGKLLPLKKGYDLCREMDCVKNETEEHADYQAWWYCCFPAKLVREDNFPLPFFLHYDDVEWGLRNMKTLIRMNGICVWHEAFEEKYSQVTRYYDWRNRLICMALYEKSIRRADLAVDMVKEYLREGFLYRYKGIHLYLTGIRDFLRGADFFMNEDAESAHRRLLEQTDTAGGWRPDEKELQRMLRQLSEAGHYCPGAWTKLWRTMSLNGYLFLADRSCYLPMEIASCFYSYRSRENVFYDKKSDKCIYAGRDRRLFLKYAVQTVRMILLLFLKGRHVQKEYNNRVMEAATAQFWESCLAVSSRERSGRETCIGEML